MVACSSRWLKLCLDLWSYFLTFQFLIKSGTFIHGNPSNQMAISQKSNFFIETNLYNAIDEDQLMVSVKYCPTYLAEHPVHKSGSHSILFLKHLHFTVRHIFVLEDFLHLHPVRRHLPIWTFSIVRATPSDTTYRWYYTCSLVDNVPLGRNKCKLGCLCIDQGDRILRA